MRFWRHSVVGIAAVVVAGVMLFFAYPRDNDASLPDGVIPVSLDESTIYLLPIDDHAGFLPELVRSNPEIRVILHERTATGLATGRNNTRTHLGFSLDDLR